MDHLIKIYCLPKFYSSMELHELYCYGLCNAKVPHEDQTTFAGLKRLDLEKYKK
ncbi:hypothetical protein Syun_007010 [Stephania yunnanensis]|uniref:Uncharacterized protein n=1 Tax=Stephania yunnanensis TaxID=152371 RepID=A0AAP0KZF2_9MAGN